MAKAGSKQSLARVSSRQEKNTRSSVKDVASPSGVISIGGENYRVGSTSANAALAAGGVAAPKNMNTKRDADQFRDASGVLQTDPLSQAENKGAVIPERIEPGVNPFETPAINTSQPSPQTAQVNAPNAPLQASGSTLAPSPTGAQDFAKTYQQGFATAKTNLGAAEAPQTSAQGMSMVQSSMPKTQEQYQPLPEVQSEMDKAVNTYTQAIADFINPKNQRKSLVDEYKALSKDLGIGELQADLMDINRIMDGTEDDIRSEITAASGLATESQVQAMTIGRNKSLLKKAQFISDQLVAAKDQLAVMSQLNAQDRQAQEARIASGISMLGNVITIKQSMQKAAQDNYRWYAEKAGMDSLYASTGGDPFNVNMVEKTLGMPPGGLQKAAVQAQKERAQKEAMDALDIQAKQASIRASNASVAKTYADMAKDAAMSNFTTPPLVNPKTGRPDPRNQLSSVINATGIKSDDKLKLTGAVLSAAQDFAENNPDGNFAGTGPIRAGFLTVSQKGQKNRTYLSALEGTVEAWMTGASVAEDQQARIKRDLIPKVSNTDKQIRQKVNALADYMLSYAGGSLASQGVDFTPQSVDFFSNPVIPGPDGNEYEIIQK